MKLNKKKLTKKIWVYGDLWDLVQIISPNKYDDFLLLSREMDSVHEDGTPSIEMVLIDAHNNDFYPNSKKVKKLMDKRKLWQEEKGLDDRELTTVWLSMFK